MRKWGAVTGAGLGLLASAVLTVRVSPWLALPGQFFLSFLPEPGTDAGMALAVVGFGALFWTLVGGAAGALLDRVRSSRN